MPWEACRHDELLAKASVLAILNPCNPRPSCAILSQVPVLRLTRPLLELAPSSPAVSLVSAYMPKQ
jgi:hypothetical protein